MVLKLYGHPISTCTKRVMTVLEELSVPFELITLDIFNRDHKTEWYLAMQPFGQAPALDDDGFIVFESRAICRYIALKYGGIGKVIPDPTDIKNTALFEQAVCVELCNFDPNAAGLAWENLFKKNFGQETDEALTEKLKTTLDAKLSAYDVMLGKTKYLAGDECTLADLFHLPYGALLPVQGIDFLESERYPNVARWWKAVSSRPSWTKVNST